MFSNSRLTLSLEPNWIIQPHPVLIVKERWWNTFQRPSTSPILDVQGMATVLKLRKRRFQCKVCRRVSIAKNSLVKKNCQISQPVWAKITQLLSEKRLHISVSTVQRQLNAFTLKENFEVLPEILSWDDFARNKGRLAFIAQDFETMKIVAVLENNRQTTSKNHFYKYSRQAREAVRVVPVDMSGAYIPIIRKLFPKAEIVLDRFHLVQHLSRAMMTNRIAIMKSFDKKSLPYRAMKNHWRILQKDSRKLSELLWPLPITALSFSREACRVIFRTDSRQCR